MTTLYARGGVFYVGFPDQAGRWHKRTTRTRDKRTARAMSAMFDDLGPRGKQAWDLLAAVRDGRVDVSTLYAAFAANDLKALRERLNDVDLSILVDAWLESLRESVKPDTIDHYEFHVRSLIPEGKEFPRTALSFERLTSWLNGLTGKAGTRRKYHAAMSSFCQYLRLRRVLDANPMRDVRPPAPSRPRERYLDHETVLSLVNAQVEPYRTVSALLHGTGAEVSALLQTIRGDVDLTAGTMRVRGSKTAQRDRTVHVEPWALSYLRRYLRKARLLPTAPLFAGLNRWTVSDKHRQTCLDLEIQNYQLRDARHTFAVRAVRAGAPFEIVALQLGHTNTAMVARVYGRFRPSSSEIKQWFEVAALRDKKGRAGR
jgi:integrase